MKKDISEDQRVHQEGLW